MQLLSFKGGRGPRSDGQLVLLDNPTSGQRPPAVITRTSLPGGGHPLVHHDVSSADPTIPVGTKATPQTVEQAQREYNALQDEWNNAKCRSTLKSLLHASAPDWGWDVNKCILFAIGSLTGWHDTMGDGLTTYWRRQPMLQLVVFMEMVGHLATHRGERPAVYVQEPCLTELDEAFLRTLKIEVVQHPQGQGLVDSRTLTFAAFWGDEFELLCQDVELRPPIHVGISTNRLVKSIKFRTEVVKSRRERILQAVLFRRQSAKQEMHPRLVLIFDRLTAFRTSRRKATLWRFSRKCEFCEACGGLRIYVEDTLGESREHHEAKVRRADYVPRSNIAKMVAQMEIGRESEKPEE